MMKGDVHLHLVTLYRWGVALFTFTYWGTAINFNVAYGITPRQHAYLLCPVTNNSCQDKMSPLLKGNQDEIWDVLSPRLYCINPVFGCKMSINFVSMPSPFPVCRLQSAILHLLTSLLT